MLEKNPFNKFKTEDDRFVSYRPTRSIEILRHIVEPLNCIINVSNELKWIEVFPILTSYLEWLAGCKNELIFPILTSYLEWLAGCKNELIDYFHLRLGEDLPDAWFRNIEVYSVDITFLTLDDYGATVSFGESLFPDHVIELDFEKYEIDTDRLNG